MNPLAKYRNGDTAATIILQARYGLWNTQAKDVIIRAIDKDSNRFPLTPWFGATIVHNIEFCATKNINLVKKNVRQHGRKNIYIVNEGVLMYMSQQKITINMHRISQSKYLVCTSSEQFETQPQHYVHPEVPYEQEHLLLYCMQQFFLLLLGPLLCTKGNKIWLIQLFKIDIQMFCHKDIG